MNKLNRILLAVLAFQVALVLFFTLRGDETSIGKLDPVLADFAADKVERIRIFDKTSKGEDPAADEDEAPAKGKPGDKPAVELVKKGEAWVLASHFDYPVETDKVTEFLDKVEGMRSRAPIASGKARQSQLEVADASYQRKVVMTAGGKETVFFLGASAGQRQASVRVAGSDDIHGVTGLTTLGVGARPSNWIDTAYIDVPDDRVASFDVVNGNGSFHFERAASGDGWQATAGGQPISPPAGMELSKGEIDKVVNRATKTYLKEPGDPKQAIDKPLATLTLRLKPEEAEGEKPEEEKKEGKEGEEEQVSTPDAALQERVFEIAAAPQKDRYYMREKGRAQAALVEALSITDLVELSRDRLIAKIGEKKEPAEGQMPQGQMPMEGLPPGFDPSQLVGP